MQVMHINLCTFSMQMNTFRGNETRHLSDHCEADVCGHMTAMMFSMITVMLFRSEIRTMK